MLDRLARLESDESTVSFEVLRRELLDGRDDAWARLVSKYSRFVWSVAYKSTAGAADREDAASAIYSRVFERLARYDYRLIRNFEGRCRFTSYLFRIVRTERKAWFAERASHACEETPDRDIPDPEAPLPPVLRPDALREAVRTAAERLSDTDRAILRARFRDACKYREIADRMGLRDTHQAARAVYRALDRLDAVGELCRRERLGESERILIERFLKRELFEDPPAGRDP